MDNAISPWDTLLWTPRAQLKCQLHWMKQRSWDSQRNVMSSGLLKLRRRVPMLRGRFLAICDNVCLCRSLIFLNSMQAPAGFLCHSPEFPWLHWIVCWSMEMTSWESLMVPHTMNNMENAESPPTFLKLSFPETGLDFEVTNSALSQAKIFCCAFFWHWEQEEFHTGRRFVRVSHSPWKSLFFFARSLSVGGFFIPGLLVPRVSTPSAWHLDVLIRTK